MRFIIGLSPFLHILDLYFMFHSFMQFFLENINGWLSVIVSTKKISLMNVCMYVHMYVVSKT